MHETPSPITYVLEDRVAVITADSPPVNALSARVREGLVHAFAKAASDPAVSAVVLNCSWLPARAALPQVEPRT